MKKDRRKIFGLFFIIIINKKNSPANKGRGVKKGGDLLSHWIAVQSALAGLTVLFGMGRGAPRRHSHLVLFVPSTFTMEGIRTYQYLDIFGIHVILMIRKEFKRTLCWRKPYRLLVPLG